MKLSFGLIILFIISSFALQAQSIEEFNPTKYKEDIEKERAIKDSEMRTDEHSPIPDDEKQYFKKLNYYKPNVEYRKEAAFERFENATHFLMITSTNRLPEYSLYGVIKFEHENKTYSLNVYQNIELVKKPGYEKHLFVPFNDLTNGHDTYGGGRFLDVTETGADTLVIDFNKAYNPYCAYNHKYSCPIPPETNSLNIKIQAGEKKWHK